MLTRIFLALYLLACLMLDQSVLAVELISGPVPTSTIAKEKKSQLIPVKVGILAFRGKQEALENWTPTADYLSKSITGYDFKIVPLSLAEMEEEVSKGNLEFTLTNSGHYITLASNYGGSRLVTMNTRGTSSQENVTGSVIFTRADRTDITKLKDLRGKTFMSVAPKAFCYEMAWQRLQEHGINPNKDFAKLLFVGFPQDYIASAVQRGKIDAGNIRTGLLEELAAEGKIKLSDFRILAQKKLKGFPYITSTKTYPQWPFIKLRHTDKLLAQKVAIALLSMGHDSKAARIGKYAGWTVPLDYTPVHNLFKQLQIGPYADTGPITASKIIKQYGPWIGVALVMLTFMFAWSMRTEVLVRSRTKELSKTNKELANQITERHRAEENARQRQAELARVGEMNSMGEFASGIAHELNHPLATITNYATGCIRRMKTGRENKEEMVEILERISRQATRASQIIGGLRDNMREDKRERNLININELVSELPDLLEFNLKNSSSKLQLELADALPTALVDPVQIEQVLLNLVGNGIDAMKTANSTERSIKVTTARNENSDILVTISDTGPGISGEMRGKIFYPFVSTKNEGMGLGLSISCSIIKDHGGQLWIEESGTQGTVFRFNLPAEETNPNA